MFHVQVFGCSGTGTSEALLAAIQRAVDDGMDIINLSLGEPSGYEAVSKMLKTPVRHCQS
jgi:subtilisin family serine protease